MSANNYFRFLSTSTIVINLIVGIGSLYLIERIIPAIDEVLNENAYSVSSVLKMQETLLLQASTKESKENQKVFWEAFENAKSNVTIDGEEKVIAEIEVLAKEFWQGQTTTLPQLSQKLTYLSDLNLSTMNNKSSQAKSLGLAGAWALGFLILLTLALQLSLRRKMFDSLILPATSLLSVITDYSFGNYQRRFSSTSETSHEIKRTGEVLNKILDENLSFKLN